MLAGLVLYPMGKEALRFFHDFSSTCPDEVSTVGLLMTAPDSNLAVGSRLAIAERWTMVSKS